MGLNLPSSYANVHSNEPNLPVLNKNHLPQIKSYLFLMLEISVYIETPNLRVLNTSIQFDFYNLAFST